MRLPHPTPLETVVEKSYWHFEFNSAYLPKVIGTKTLVDRHFTCNKNPACDKIIKCLQWPQPELFTSLAIICTLKIWELIRHESLKRFQKQVSSKFVARYLTPISFSSKTKASQKNCQKIEQTELAEDCTDRRQIIGKVWPCSYRPVVPLSAPLRSTERQLLSN